MKLFTSIATAAVIGASFIAVNPVKAQYFNPYSDPMDNVFTRAADEIMDKYHDNYPSSTRSSSTCTVDHAYGDTYNVDCY